MGEDWPAAHNPPLFIEMNSIHPNQKEQIQRLKIKKNKRKSSRRRFTSSIHLYLFFTWLIWSLPLLLQILSIYFILLLCCLGCVWLWRRRRLWAQSAPQQAKQHSLTPITLSLLLNKLICLELREKNDWFVCVLGSIGAHNPLPPQKNAHQTNQ